MTEFIGIQTTSAAEGGGVLRLVYPASKVVLLNDRGTLGVMVEGQEKAISATVIVTFGSIAAGNAWLQEKA